MSASKPSNLTLAHFTATIVSHEPLLLKIVATPQAMGNASTLQSLQAAALLLQAHAIVMLVL